MISRKSATPRTKDSNNPKTFGARTNKPKTCTENPAHGTWNPEPIMLLNRFYYHLRPFIPRQLQIIVRRQIALSKRKSYSHIWPIDERASKPLEGWTGWPHRKRFALVLTHDVDTAKGQETCHKLMPLEKTLGFRSSFNFVPERYDVSQELRQNLANNGFEVGVHGLYHDGKLYASRSVFEERAIKINHYLKEWKSVAFRSPSMHHNLDWLHDLDIEYDASTFDTDPFEPQSDGVGTIFPFWVQGDSNQNGYVELPYTLPQDSTLFIIMKEKSIEIWKQKLDWIADKGGMALLNSHPDYMNFDGKKLGIEEYPVSYYQEFLHYIKRKYQGQYWHVLPKDMARFWSNNLMIEQAL